MIFKNIKRLRKLFFILPIFLVSIIVFQISYNLNAISVNANVNWDNWVIENETKKYIKWVDFTPTFEVLNKTSKLDIDSHTNNEDVKFNWIELISFLACKYGGDFKKFNQKDLNGLVDNLKNRKNNRRIN